MKSEPSLEYRELTQRVIGVFYEVYNELGHGFWSRYIKKPSDLL